MVPQLVPAGHQRAQLVEPHAQPVAPGLGDLLRHIPWRTSVVSMPVRAALGDAEPAAELGDAEFRLGGQAVEQVERRGDRLDAARAIAVRGLARRLRSSAPGLPGTPGRGPGHGRGADHSPAGRQIAAARRSTASLPAHSTCARIELCSLVAAPPADRPGDPAVLPLGLAHVGRRVRRCPTGTPRGWRDTWRISAVETRAARGLGDACSGSTCRRRAARRPGASCSSPIRSQLFSKSRSASSGVIRAAARRADSASSSARRW